MPVQGAHASILAAQLGGGDLVDAIAALFPAGRWGMPDDPARLLAWLATDEAGWITGQVIDSEGGFRR